jgi:hypothetical protein
LKFFPGCDKSQFSDVKLCSKSPDFPPTTAPNISQTMKDAVTTKNDNYDKRIASPVTQHETESSGTGFITVISTLVVLVLLIVCWVFYAYTHPHTSSGQFLIQYRPNAWSWRRGEARYTAATIHM